MQRVLSSSVQTKKFAGGFFKKILKSKFLTSFRRRSGSDKKALIITLSGNLGAGKTTFVQGFLRAAGVKLKIASPTFTIIKNYKLRIKNYGNFKKIYHIDCYRIHKPKELISLGLKNIFENPQNIILIEWPERIKRVLPKNIIKVKLKYGEKENKRIILIK